MTIKYIKNSAFVHICQNYLPTLEVAVAILYLNLVLFYYWSFYNLGRQLSYFGFSFWNPILNSVTNVLLCWNKLGRFVSIKSIHMGLSGSLKHVGSLIKLLYANGLYVCHSQKFFIEFSSSIPTLKSPMKMKLPKVLVCSSMTQFKHSRWLETFSKIGENRNFDNRLSMAGP